MRASRYGVSLLLTRLRIIPYRAPRLLASNACVGGPTTAAGMATTKGWHQLLVPAILVGVLGYAVATFASIALGQTALQALWLQRAGVLL